MHARHQMGRAWRTGHGRHVLSIRVVGFLTVHREPSCSQAYPEIPTYPSDVLTDGQLIIQVRKDVDNGALLQLNSDRVARVEDIRVKRETNDPVLLPVPLHRIDIQVKPVTSKVKNLRGLIPASVRTYQMVEHHRRRSLPDGHDRSRPTRNPRRGKSLCGSEYFTTKQAKAASSIRHSRAPHHLEAKSIS
jgi:hypothetical protein